MQCPHCKGSGKARHLPLKCQWCKGITRVSPLEAETYAKHIEMLARGGYVCGDYSEEEMHEMLAESKGILQAVAFARDHGDSP